MRFVFNSVAALLLVMSVGCSNDGGDDDDDFRPPAEGAFFVNLVAGSHVGDCMLGAAQPIAAGQVGENTHDTLLTNGVGGAEVACMVADEGGAFRVQATIGAGVERLELDAQLTSAASSSAPGAGSLTISGASTAGVDFASLPSEPCAFYLANEAQRSQLAPGKVWLTFECSTVHSDAADRTCAVQVGYAALQLCATQ